MSLRAALLAGLLVTAACAAPGPAHGAVNAPAAARVAREAPGPRQAVFAGGCFWGVEAVFSHVRGVTSVVTGYHGGSKGTATYERIGRGDTGHAEAVRVTYDPAQVRYDELLRIFFAVITDPTQLNRQGPDVGSQYRNALIPLTEEQRLVASAYLAQLRASGLWNRPIVTRLERAQAFYPAEAHHQDFAAKHPQHPYIRAWDVPKVAALRRLFPAAFKRDFTRG